jgi:hypothetical protein
LLGVPFGSLVAAALGTHRHHEVELADTMPDGWQSWLDWQRAVASDNATEIKAVEADRGRYLG